MMKHGLFLFISFSIVISAEAQIAGPDIFSFSDLVEAQKFWQPQFGSPPVQLERLPDGSNCLVLSGVFKAENDRLCWDYVGQMNLSEAGAISAEFCVEHPERIKTVGIYLGTPGGWHAHFVGAGFFASGQELKKPVWRQRSLELDEFGAEGEPGGWENVQRFRFSVWGASPGPVTFRLRNFTTKARDWRRNYVRNGSFEVPGPLPYAWGSGHWGIGHLPWAADMDLWRRHFCLDTTQAHSGQRSLKIVNAPGLPKLQAVSAWLTLRDKPAAQYTLSVWARADREDMPVSLAVGNVRGTDKTGTQWRRLVLQGIPPGQYLSIRIGAEAEGTLWLDDVQIQAEGHDTEEFHPHPAEAELIAREATVDWTPPPRLPQIAAGRRIRGPVKPSVVRIDSTGRFLVNGQPYLMHAMGLEFISDLKMLDVVAQAGFADVCIEINARITTEQLREYLDYAAQAGLRVIPWLDGNIPLERFQEHIIRLREHPALLCWYVYDEPSGEHFAKAEERLRLAKKLDPQHPALINYLSNKLTGHRGDIYSTDIYPIPHSEPLAAIKGVATMAEAAAKEHKPVWMWLQGTGYAYWMDREPTPRELSCMAYGSLIAGARGIYYFAQIPRTKECWAEMRALCVELAHLAPVLGSLDKAPRVKCDTPSVMAQSYRLGQQIYVLAVNTRAEPSQATLALADTKGEAIDIVFEGRRLPFQKGKWEVRFGPYERHVFRLVRKPAAR